MYQRRCVTSSRVRGGGPRPVFGPTAWVLSGATAAIIASLRSARSAPRSRRWPACRSRRGSRSQWPALASQKRRHGPTPLTHIPAIVPPRPAWRAGAPASQPRATTRTRHRPRPSPAAAGTSRAAGRGRDDPAVGVVRTPLVLPVPMSIPSRSWLMQALTLSAETNTGIPFSTAVPASASNPVEGVSTFELAPGSAAATGPQVPGATCPQPCGRLTTPAGTASVTDTVARTVPTALSTSAFAPSARRRRSASSGCTWRVHRFDPPASRGTLCIHELLLRSDLRPTRRRPLPRQRGVRTSSSSAIRAASSSSWGGAASMRPLGVRSTSGSRGRSGPRSMPCGAASTEASVRPSAVAPEAVAVRARADHQVEQPLLPPPRLDCAEQVEWVAAVRAGRLGLRGARRHVQWRPGRPSRRPSVRPRAQTQARRSSTSPSSSSSASSSVRSSSVGGVHRATLRTDRLENAMS